LRELYPGKNIVANPPDRPTEIICELQPASQNPDSGIAIAVIDSSKPHFHRRTTEEYIVLKGTLELHLDGTKEILNKGEQAVILPGKIHCAKGNETWVVVVSRPAWTPEDHYEIEL